MIRYVTYLSVVFTAGLLQAAEPSKDIVSDPQAAAKLLEFQVQGEYAGQLTLDGKKQKAGVQVIALGGNKFDAVLYPGGLPGDGGSKNKKTKATGATVAGVTTLKGSTFSATIKGGKMNVSNSGGDAIGTLAKVERKSPTLGAKPPKGATVLFDGKSVKGFPGAKMTKDGLLMVPATSKKQLGDHVLHLEFRTPFKPLARGQGRGNSGVYAQSRYEIQVLDSFGLEGKNNECGGIYSIAEPSINMCFPPLSWQTYDIDFKAARYTDGMKTKNARITIRHNGVVIHNDLELPKGTPGKDGEGPEPKGVYLQGHGNPVVFRNIWVLTEG